jgi:hypothetical protein
MVLKTLDVLGPLHGYGVARRIEQISITLEFYGQCEINELGPSSHLLFPNSHGTNQC